MELRTYQQRDLDLLPQTDRHGRGFMGRSYTNTEMDETANSIRDARETGASPRGYGKRFFATTPGFCKLGDRFYLPEGFDAISPYRAEVNAEMRTLIDTGYLTSPPDAINPWQMPFLSQEYYRKMGWATDQNSRAVNPHIEQLINDERIGLNTNLGVGHTCGENIMVDVVVDDGKSVLLTKRTDLGGKVIKAPSLVRGYTLPADYGVNDHHWFLMAIRPITREGIFRAARRIVTHKTGIDLPDTDQAMYDIAWGSYPTLPTHTANFWTAVFTVSVRITDGASGSLIPRADRPSVHWAEKTKMHEVRPLMRSDHGRSLDACLALNK